MPYHARRLLFGLRGFRLWAAVLVFANLTTGFVATVAAAGVGELMAAETLGPRGQSEISYLRVLDPDGVPVQVFDTVEELTQSVLDEPALALLLNAMESDERMFVVMYLQAFTDSYLYGGSVQSGIAVIGARPRWLPVTDGPSDRVLLWGPMPKGAPGVTEARFGQLPVQQMSLESVAVAWPGRSSIAYVPGDDAVVLFSPALARQARIGVATARVADVLGGFACECGVEELTGLAAAMTRADREGGAGRVYYAVSESQSVARTVVSRRAVLGLSFVALGGIALGVLLFEHSGAMIFWRRRRRAYGIEYQAGASAPALALRQQITLFAVLTAPLVTGVCLHGLLFGPGSSAQTPWHDSFGLVVLIVGVTVQVLVGIRPLLSLRQDCRPITTGGQRA